MSKREEKEVKSIWEELELGLGGGKKFRVLVHLALNPNKTFTRYALVKATGLRTPSIDRYLKTLVNLGWVKENKYKPKTYQINLDNEVIMALLDFFKEMISIRRLKIL